MSELTRFENAFAKALAGDAAALRGWLPGGGGAGLSVYRNTVAKGLVDALAASFPTVERLVGPDWFRAAARDYARAEPPAAPALVTYGEGFPTWLAAFPPASTMPYLAAVARADRAWTEAHVAGDAAPLTLEALAALGAEALAQVGGVAHPSVRVLCFADNAASLWRANRPPADPPASFEWQATPETLLVWRREGVVEHRLMAPAEAAFLTACLDGASLAQAAGAALTAEPDADLSALVAAVFGDGILIALQSALEGRP